MSTGIKYQMSNIKYQMTNDKYQKSKASVIHHLQFAICHLIFTILPFVICPLIFAILALLAAWPPPVYAQDPSSDLLNQIRFDQRLNAQVPLDLEFRDETGARVRLGDYFQRKPVVLMFAYYRCPNLCGLVLNGLAESLTRLKFNVGDEFQVVTVSIDPRDTPQIAASKKETYVEFLSSPAITPLPNSELETRNSKLITSWHFLTGQQSAIDRLAHATGFQYAYDARQDQYAHATGLMVLTPEGKISRYLYGIDFPAQDLQFALMDASQDRIGSPIDQVLLRCYHYDPITGQYSLAIMNVVRLVGLATALALGVFLAISFTWGRDKRMGKQMGPG